MEDNSVWERKDRRITRMSCIRSAVEMMVGRVANTKEVFDADDIVKLAKKFEAYVYEHEEKPGE